MELLEEYKNIVEKIKEYLISELKKRYDIEFDDDRGFLLNFTIKNYGFEVDLESRYFYIDCYTETWGRYVETFEELFEFINEIIKEFEFINEIIKEEVE